MIFINDKLCPMVLLGNYKTWLNFFKCASGDRHRLHAKKSYKYGRYSNKEQGQPLKIEKILKDGIIGVDIIMNNVKEDGIIVKEIEFKLCKDKECSSL